jgi:hypothetical protein
MKMMSRMKNEQFVKDVYFNQARPRLTRLAERLSSDTDAVIAEASAIFDEMIPRLGYIDNPQHPLAPALFICSVNLSLYLALKKRGVDVHQFGNAMLNGLMRAPIPVPQESDEVLQERLTHFAVLAQASQTSAKPGEDVFEVAHSTNADFEWGYNVTSCAICKTASTYGAIDLVPYMCAVDDVMSDKGNQGLRRSGSLALGAEHCDFRFKRGGEPQRLAQQYPEQIRFIQLGPSIPIKG